MFEIIKSGGWLMIPIIMCSVAAVAITIERALVLRTSRIAPSNLVAKVWSWIKRNEMDGQKIKELRSDSPLGEILAVGLVNSKHGRDIMKESIQEVGDHVIHDLERYLSSLGTIAAITPLLGLLGTVLGMIKVFNAIVMMGTGDPAVLAGGISEALITTAAGMSVAIPSLFFHRFFMRRVEELTVSMEQEAIKLVDVLHGEREVDISGAEIK